MADASVASYIFAVVSFIVISLLVLLLLRHYVPLRSTPAYLIVPVFLALALPCYIILLVPIDLTSSDGETSRGIWLPERTVLVIWRITYWLTFILTWFLLPFLGEYVDSGEKDSHGRLLYSLRSNAQYMIIYFGTAIAGLVYFIWYNGFHLESIKSLVMALAYAWGLLLAITLMGHGLVALPRRLWKNASVSGRLRSLQTQAPKTKDKLEEAAEELDALENTVTQLRQKRNGMSRDMQGWIDELADTAIVSDARPPAMPALRTTNVSVPAVVTERYLADLTRKLKRARHKKARFVLEWSSLCDSAQDTKTILDSAASKKLDFGRERPGQRSILERITVVTPTMRYHLHARIVPYMRICIAGFLATASVMLVFSEVIRSFAPRFSIMSLTVVHHPNAESGKVGFGGQLIAAAWLLYMDACTLYAISDVKVWGNRALVKRQTYGESACWYALQVAKLTVPLSYNFITMLPRDVFQQTSFYSFLGQLINLTPLGEGFSNFFPCFLLIPVLASVFNLYGKVKNVIGFGVLEDDNDDDPHGISTGGWREGRALIDRELLARSDGGGSVGLATQAPSSDLERGRPSASAATVPPIASQAPQQHLNPLSAHVQEANQQFNAITNQRQEEEPLDDSARHFYQDFGERVRNTFDTMDRPEWMKNLGKGFKAPRWMQNDQRDRDDGPASGIARWFGGRPEEGRLQL